jgi:hypothetical protein
MTDRESVFERAFHPADFVPYQPPPEGIMKRQYTIDSILAAVAVFTMLPNGGAAPVEFTIDEAQSKITMAGKVLGNALTEQGTGSLTTSFYGSIRADVTATGIQFIGGSSLTARTNGVWKPGPKGAAGSAPADYAAQASTLFASVKGALRNVVLDVTSGVLPVSNGQFDASTLLFQFPTNSTASFDYDAGLIGAGGVALSGASTNRIAKGASIQDASGSQTLTIPVDTEFKFKALVPDDSVVQLSGMLVGKAVALPEITSIAVTNQTVILHVQGTGPNPGVLSSPDLKQWTSRAPTQTSTTNGVVLTLPVGGAQEFYRVTK